MRRDACGTCSAITRARWGRGNRPRLRPDSVLFRMPINSRWRWRRPGSRSETNAPAGRANLRAGAMLRLRGLARRQDELAVLDRDALARVAFHAHDLLRAIQLVRHVEAGLLASRVEHDDAFRAGIGLARYARL